MSGQTTGYCDRDLARILDAGYSQHVARVYPGIGTRFSRPAPFRFDRAITTFRRDGDRWRRSDETHRDVTFEVADAIAILRECGVESAVRPSFGDEVLPTGLVVLVGRRR